MGPADLHRLVSRLDGAEEMEAAGLNVWAVGDSMEVEGRAIRVTEVIVVQDPQSLRHGRIVLRGYAADAPEEEVTGSFPVLFPAAHSS